MDELRQRVRATTDAYERYAGDYADKPDDRRWLQPLVDAFAALLAPGALVLDLGCAAGRETVELQAAGLRVIGLDLVAAFLRIAQVRYPAVGYVRGDALHLPLASQAIDGVWAMASLLHLTPDEAGVALAEVRRVLKPGGARSTARCRSAQRRAWCRRRRVRLCRRIGITRSRSRRRGGRSWRGRGLRSSASMRGRLCRDRHRQAATSARVGGSTRLRDGRMDESVVVDAAQ